VFILIYNKRNVLMNALQICVIGHWKCGCEIYCDVSGLWFTISVFISGIFKLLLYGKGGEGRINKQSLPVALPTQYITQLYISLKNMTTLTEELRKIKIHHYRRYPRNTPGNLDHSLGTMCPETRVQGIGYLSKLSHFQ